MSQRSPFNKRNQPTMSDEESTKTGMARKSASSAKPAREAAASVRVVKKQKDKLGNTHTSGMSKEEKKAQRKAEREEDDQVYNIANMVLQHNELYKKNRRIWWGLMCGGLAFVIISFAIAWAVGSQNATTTSNVLAIAALVLAYVGIFGALIWDFVKIRPIRTQTQDEVRSMSVKRRIKVVEDCNAKDEAKEAAKKAKKASKAASQADEAE